MLSRFIKGQIKGQRAAKNPVSIENTGFSLAQKEGFDLPSGAGRVAALECPRHSIHYRSRSNP
jgi:hypothetical protein